MIVGEKLIEYIFCEFAGMTKLGLQSSMTDNGSPRRRLMGQEGLGMGPGGVGQSPMDQRLGLGPIRPQLRPQRSLDNRLNAAGQQQNPQDMLTNQLDQQQQNNAMFSSNNQVGVVGGTQQRVDNQGQIGMDGNQMNINTSTIGAGGMTVSSMSNQLNAMSGSLMSSMPGQQQPQQQSQQLGGHQQQQNNQFTASSTSTSMGYQQQPNQLTMANNNNSMQQPQQVYIMNDTFHVCIYSIVP